MKQYKKVLARLKFSQGNLGGFTLIELLVVIAIIGILSTLAVVSLGSARLKARDAKRLSDMRSLQSALEIFNTDNPAVGYPGSSATNGCAIANIETCCLDDSASNPGWRTAGNCTAGSTLITMSVDPGVAGNVYAYAVTAVSGVNTGYSVNFQLESPASPMKKFNCLTSAGMTGDATGTDGDATCP